MITKEQLEALHFSFKEPCEVIAHRIQKAWTELLSGLTTPAPQFKTFATIANGIIIEHSIDFTSICEHHFLPFIGECKIEIELSDRMAGLSKYNRLVNYIASRPSTQENLTQEIFNQINTYLKPKQLKITTNCRHTCVICRGVFAVNSQTKCIVGGIK